MLLKTNKPAKQREGVLGLDVVGDTDRLARLREPRRQVLYEVMRNGSVDFTHAPLWITEKSGSQRKNPRSHILLLRRESAAAARRLHPSQILCRPLMCLHRGAGTLH